MDTAIHDDFAACSNDYDTKGDALRAFGNALAGYGLRFGSHFDLPGNNCATTVSICNDNSIRAGSAFMRWHCVERSCKWEVSGFII